MMAPLGNLFQHMGNLIWLTCPNGCVFGHNNCPRVSIHPSLAKLIEMVVEFGR